MVGYHMEQFELIEYDDAGRGSSTLPGRMSPHQDVDGMPEFGIGRANTQLRGAMVW